MTDKKSSTDGRSVDEAAADSLSTSSRRTRPDAAIIADEGPDLDEEGGEGDERLLGSFKIHQVVESGNYELAKFLIESDINLIDSIDDDIYGRTPLIICAFKKSDAHFKLARFLLDCGCDVNIQGNYKWNNWTALMTACYHDNARMVELLIEANANVELEDIESNTAWQLALENSHNACIQILLKEMERKGIEERLGIEKDIQEAVYNNELAAVQASLLKLEASSLRQIINSTPIGTHSLLYRACRNANAEIVRLLLEKGSIAREHYYTRYSPLYIACHIGSVDIVRLLVKRFPHLIRVKTIEKFLPFHAACSQGRLDIARLLVEFATASENVDLDSALRELGDAAPLAADCKARFIRAQRSYDNHWYLAYFDLNALDFNDQNGFFAAVVGNRSDVCEYLLSVRVRQMTPADVAKYKQLKRKLSRRIQQLAADSTSSSSTKAGYQTQTSETATTTAAAKQPVTPSSSGPSFFDQLKNVFMDIKPPFDAYTINYTSPFFEGDEPDAEVVPGKKRELDEKPVEAATPTGELRADELATPDAEAAPPIFLNPINLNQYSKFGTTCIHEAIRNRNHQLVKLLLAHGADSNLPIYDVSNSSDTSESSSGRLEAPAELKVKSNALCEALRLRDEYMVRLLVYNSEISEANLKLALRTCHELGSSSTPSPGVGPEAHSSGEAGEISGENFEFYKRRMTGQLLKTKLLADNEYKINVHALKLRSLQSQMSTLGASLTGSLTTAAAAGTTLNDSGLILNWNGLEPRLDVLFESWLLDSARHFKVSSKQLQPTRRAVDELVTPTSAMTRDELVASFMHEPQEAPLPDPVQQSLRRLHLHAITRIDLSNNAIEALPLAVLQIESLRFLKLAGNRLRALPSNRHPVFDDLEPTTTTTGAGVGWSCNLLEELDFSDNQIVGLLPAALFQLKSLKHLNAARNQIERLPFELWSAPSLFDLNLAHNQLSYLPLVPPVSHPAGFGSRQSKKAGLQATANSSFSRSRRDDFAAAQPLAKPTNLPTGRQLTRVPVIDHPLKTPVDEFPAPLQDHEEPVPATAELQARYEEKEVVKANFWRANSSDSANISLFCGVGIGNNLTSSLSKHELAAKIQPGGVGGGAMKTSQSIGSALSASAAASHSSHALLHGQSASKLVELNLSHNQFRRVPECLSCLIPKLVKLNMSSNKLRSMGAICDLPVSLKFLDLSNNQIKWPMRLLNNNLMKFVLLYYDKYSDANSAASGANSVSAAIDLASSLLMNNEFCYLNLVNKLKMARGGAAAGSAESLLEASVVPAGARRGNRLEERSARPLYPMPNSSSSYSIVQANSPAPQPQHHLRSKTRDPHRQMLLEQPVIGLDPSGGGGGGGARARSSSRRRTRSQSRNFLNRNQPSGQNSPQTPVGKKILPFDLFLVNLRYNQSYNETAAAGSRSRPSEQQFAHLTMADLLSANNKLANEYLELRFNQAADRSLVQPTKSPDSSNDLSSGGGGGFSSYDDDDEEEIFYWFKEKQLLSRFNIQIFLDQLCAHKKHLKLENLKSLNLANNKLGICHILLDLDQPYAGAAGAEDVASTILNRIRNLRSAFSPFSAPGTPASATTAAQANKASGLSDDDLLSEDYDSDGDSGAEEGYSTPGSAKSRSLADSPASPGLPPSGKAAKKPSRTRLRDKFFANASPGTVSQLQSTPVSGKSGHASSASSGVSYNRKQLKFWTKSEQRARLVAKLIYPNLTHLDISGNRIRKLPSTLSLLDHLSYLNASSNGKLTRVSPSIGLLTKLWNFDLKNCSFITDPPMLDALVKQRIKTSDLLGYLKSILEHSRPYNRVKLMLVGVQAIGKTSLLGKLREEGLQKPQQSSSWNERTNPTAQSGGSSSSSGAAAGPNISTVGIDINEWVYEKPKSSRITLISQQQEQAQLFQYPVDSAASARVASLGPITFRTWDFGGQREYYSTHQYFISKRALYLVCWKLSEHEKGINEIHTWLSNIQTRAPGSPVIIVGTHQDQLAKLKNYKEISAHLQRVIYERFVLRGASGTCETNETSAAYPPIMASIEVSSRTGHNIKLLARLIYDVAAQMKAPGLKDQLLLEQKIPVTYLALEECVMYVLNKLKQASRNPVLSRADYLKEVREAVEALYPDPEAQHDAQQPMTMVRGAGGGYTVLGVECPMLIRFRDDAEIMQATQFMHENGVLVHYNDVALRDLFFLDPQWLCDVLATVVAIREVNPFAAKGIMKIKDLLVLFKGRRIAQSAQTGAGSSLVKTGPAAAAAAARPSATDCDEIMSFIVDLLGKFELALTWDNEHLLIPSLLPSEAMLKFANQDIRMGIVSKQKAYSDQINSISFNNLIAGANMQPAASGGLALSTPPIQASASFSSFLNEPGVAMAGLQSTAPFKLVNSVSQMAFPNQPGVDCPFQSKPYVERDAPPSAETNIVRLYCLSYLPSGFFSRLITRILSDSILKEYLLELVELEYCLFNGSNSELSREAAAADSVTQASLEALMDFVCQEAEWRCWQTGIELKYLDYTLIRIKELIQDPLIDLNSSSGGGGASSSSSASTPSDTRSYSPDVFLSRPVLYRDCENELKLKSTFPLTLSATSKQASFSFMECFASFTNYKIVKAKPKFTQVGRPFKRGKESEPAAAAENNEDNEDDVLVKIRCNRRVCIKLFAQIIEIIDSLLEDWYPDLGTRFMQDSKGDYLVTRLAPCSLCVQEALGSRSRANSMRSGAGVKISRDDDHHGSGGGHATPPQSRSFAEGSFLSHVYSSSAYRSPNQSHELPAAFRSPNQLSVERAELADLGDSFRDRSLSLDDYDEIEKLKYFSHFDWIFGFMLDDICYAVLSQQQNEPSGGSDTQSTSSSVTEATLLRCPRHGHQAPRQIAPDLAFEDVDEKLLVSSQRNLSIESLLGRGSFGSVFAGSLHIRDKSIKVAVKVLESMSNASISKLNEAGGGSKAPPPPPPLPAKTGNKAGGNLSRFWNYRKQVRLAAKAYTQARQEIAILNTLKHDNIVAMLGLSVQPLAIILELAPRGNLKDILAQYKAAMCRLSPAIVQSAAIQVSSALVYLHSNRIIYRDLKADNVLVWRFPPPPSQLTPSASTYSNPGSSSYGLSKLSISGYSAESDFLSAAGGGDGKSVVLKLADYSISRTILPTGTKGFAGTEGFMAPEIIRFNGEETYSEKVDCFSFSMLVYELISLKHPFEGQEQIKDIVLNGGRPPIGAQESSYPTLMLDLMCLCWQDSPNDRPSAAEILKYARSYEFSHLLDVAVLEDYEQPPLMVTCLNQEADEMDEDEENLMYAEAAAAAAAAAASGQATGAAGSASDDYYAGEEEEEEEEEEEDVMDLWIVRNSTDEGMSQLEILTYENKFNCTNRKLVNVCSEPIEAICVYKSNQIWCVDSAKCIYIFCAKTYRKLNQYLLDIRMPSRIEWIYSLDNLDKLLMCSNNGTILILKAVDFKSMSPTDDLEYIMFSLSIPVHSSIVLPTRYDKSYDLWMGSENGEIFSFSLKNMRLLGSYLHSTSHHYQTSTMLANAGAEPLSQSLSDANSHVTILRTTPNDTFFLWSYVYPGSTVYLWNHASKKIMSAFNLKKAFSDLNFTPNPGCDRADFRVVDMNFLNGHLYCGVNYGVVVVLKRLTLTPLLAFNAHMHQLHKLCPLTFETRIITTTQARKSPAHGPPGQSASNASPIKLSSTSITKKTQHMLVTLGRALAPCHEEIYLSNERYRVDALSKYANCLLLCSWSCSVE